MFKRTAILVAAVWLTASCGGSDGGNDGGGSAGTSGAKDGGGTAGATSDTVTLGQVCDSTGMAFCNRLVACQLATYADCFNPFTGSCCADATTCSQVATGMNAARLSAYETACDTAFKAEACADVGVGTVPAACATVP
jgi:hypothetical protein